MAKRPARATSGRYVSRLTSGTLAVIMAGGRGERLKGLTEHRAKPATPFGGKFRIIDFVLSNCVNSGIRQITVLTQYKAQSLIQHIHRGWGYMRGEFGEFVEVIPAQQKTGSHWYRGTADAVYQNIDVMHSHRPKHVLVLAGDHIYKMDYGPMIAYHVEKGADITVGVVEVPDRRCQGIRRAHGHRMESRHALRREVADARSHAGPQGRGAGLHGHLRLQPGAARETAASKTPRTRSPSTISARTSSRTPSRSCRSLPILFGTLRPVRSLIGAMLEQSMHFTRPISSWSGSIPSSISTTRTGRSGPTRRRRRRRNSCSMKTAGAASPSTRWCRAAPSSRAPRCASRCCSPACASRSVPWWSDR